MFVCGGCSDSMSSAVGRARKLAVLVIACHEGILETDGNRVVVAIACHEDLLGTDRKLVVVVVACQKALHRCNLQAKFGRECL